MYRRSVYVFALIMAVACAHPAAPITSAAPARDGDAATAHGASESKPRAPDAAVSSTVPHPDEAQSASGDDRAPVAEAEGCKVFDPKDPACKGACPEEGSPFYWTVICDQKCPTPPDPNIAACRRTMPCPNPPDRRVRACMPHRPTVDDGVVVARVLKADATPDARIVTLGAGSAMGIGKTWTGSILVGDTDTPLAGGDVELIRVDKNLCIGKVHLTVDQLVRNNRVRLRPPD